MVGAQTETSPDFSVQACVTSKLRDYLAITSVTVVVLVRLPDFPVMVIFFVPIVAFVATVIVRVEVPAPGAGIGFGVNFTVCRTPWPVVDSEIGELNPPETVVVTVKLPLLPRCTVIELGAALMLKLGVVVVTVNDTVVVATVLPDVPVTVMV